MFVVAEFAQVMHDLLAATLRSDQNIRQEAEKVTISNGASIGSDAR